MNLAIILNGISRKKKLFADEILPVLQREFAVTIFETRYAGHAEQLSREAVENRFEIILAAGGDGTLHQVVNGLLSTRAEKLPPLGLIPLGSGNDFAGAVGISLNAQELVKLIKEGKASGIDVGEITCTGSNQQPSTRFFINVCSVGMGPATVQNMQRLPSAWSPSIRYLFSILKTFFTGKPEPLELKTPTWSWGGKARVLAIANGKSFGNRIYIAPEAQPDDGVLNLFLASDLPLIKFLLSLQKLKSAKKLADSRIYYDTATEVQINSSVPLQVEAEGELVGQLPARIQILPRRILFFRPK